MRVLFDQGTPVPIRPFLVGHTVRTAAQHHWDTLKLRCVRLFPFPPVIDSVTVPFPPDAAGTIADAYGSAVRGYFHRALGRRDLAEDLTQEVFVRVVRSADR